MDVNQKAPMDPNRKRKLNQYKPLEGVREQHAMEYHEHIQSVWNQISQELALKVGRDPSTLAMNSEDDFRRANELRNLIASAVNTVTNKDIGPWAPLARIGDLYAQPEFSKERVPDRGSKTKTKDDKPRERRFMQIGNPEKPTEVAGQRPVSFFESKYLRKREKELKQFIDRVRPFEPDFSGLVVVGHNPHRSFQSIPSPVPGDLTGTVSTVNPELESEDIISEVVSTVKVSINANRLFFISTPGRAVAQSVEVSNDGTTAVYYRWELAKDVDLMTGSGTSREFVKKGDADFDWRCSESFEMARNLLPKTRSEFLFTQVSGSILPGDSEIFSFSFKSDVPGCFTQRWIMKVTPQAECETALSVSLRACCEVDRPDLSAFKAQIDSSLHESERGRCIEEVLGSIFEKVKRLVSEHSRGGEQRIEGDLLVDDRAPQFEAANKKWDIPYSPALDVSLRDIANEAWDDLGTLKFDRDWDMSLETLTKLVMSVKNGQLKRNLLARINEAVSNAQLNTCSANSNLTYSLAYVQLATMLDETPDVLQRTCAAAAIELPPFIVPKAISPEDDEDNDTARKKRHRKPTEKKKPKAPTKKSKAEEAKTSASNSPRPGGEITPEIKEEMKNAIKEILNGESKGVSQQLTRVNEIEKLDTNLDAEVDLEEEEDQIDVDIVHD